MEPLQEADQGVENPGVETPLPAQTEGASPESGSGASTDGLAANLAAQHGAATEPPGGGEATPGGKRQGRPPTHGRYSKAAGSDGKHPVALPGEEPVSEVEAPPDTRLSAVVPPDLFAKVIQESLSLGETIAQTRIESAAIMAGLTREEVAPQLKQAEIGDTRKDLVGKLAPLALQEWGVDPQLSPTAAIGLVLGPWVLGSLTAYNTLARLAQERQASNPSPGTKPS